MIEIKGKYNEAKIFTDVVDSASIAQVQELCNQEFTTGSRIRLMPDIHAGAGCTIGTTMTITDTMAQIAEAVGTVKSNVYKYLSEMEDRGILTRSKREIEINDTIQASPELNRVPILGNVSCGLPEYAEENFEEYVPLPVALFGQGDFYLLRASGNSMIEAGIDPGDLVVVRKQNTAEEGDIVVALVDNETTLKRFYRDKKHRCCRLHPENSKMKDIYVQDCTIQGVAQNVIKTL